MKKFRITINGNTYDVDVEELVSSAAAPASVSPAAQAPVAVPPPVVSPAPTPAAPVAAGSVAVKAPLPGTILKIFVNVGDVVKTGDNLCILEAMKMENEIKAASDGTVAAVHVSPGVSVSTDDLLISLS